MYYWISTKKIPLLIKCLKSFTLFLPNTLIEQCSEVQGKWSLVVQKMLVFLGMILCM